mmetsp:Transcript_18660/g.49111  ORF Transcript_18660/g.49111 Transcript_18660/m.49111 type:complete len:210 (+) Transcript_18660:456-1085(+)
MSCSVHQGQTLLHNQIAEKDCRRSAATALAMHVDLASCVAGRGHEGRGLQQQRLRVVPAEGLVVEERRQAQDQAPAPEDLHGASERKGAAVPGGRPTNFLLLLLLLRRRRRRDNVRTGLNPILACGSAGPLQELLERRARARARGWRAEAAVASAPGGHPPLALRLGHLALQSVRDAMFLQFASVRRPRFVPQPQPTCSAMGQGSIQGG